MLQFCGHVKAKWLIYTALMHSLHSSVHLFLLCFFSLVHSCECWEVFLKENDPNSAKKIPRSEVKMCRLMPPPPTHTNKYDMALSVATTHTGTYSYIYSIYIPMTNGFSGSVQSSCLKSHSVKWVFCTYRHRCMHLPEYIHLHPPPPFFFFFLRLVSVVQQRSNIPPERWKSGAVTRTQPIEVLISAREKPLGWKQDRGEWE